jgi:uroporphyrinogen-III synthase
MQVLVTRPAAQASGWVQRLRESGIDAHALPLIGIAPPADPAAVTAAWERLAEHRLVVFVSPNAAEQFFALQPPGAAWPAATLAGSTGPGTSEALRALGVPAAQLVAPAADAPQFDSEALWALLAPMSPMPICWRDAAVLIVRGDGGRDWLAEQLRAHGAQVTHLAAYRRVAPQFTPAQQSLLDAALAQPDAWVWLFSSSEAIAVLRAAAPGATWAAARAIATHPRIAQSARDAGFGQVTLARPELNALVACLQSLPPSLAP